MLLTGSAVAIEENRMNTNRTRIHCWQGTETVCVLILICSSVSLSLLGGCGGPAKGPSAAPHLASPSATQGSETRRANLPLRRESDPTIDANNPFAKASESRAAQSPRPFTDRVEGGSPAGLIAAVKEVFDGPIYSIWPLSDARSPMRLFQVTNVRCL